MKTIRNILTVVLSFCIMAVFAQSNNSTVDQSGVDNLATVNQTGSFNDSWAGQAASSGA